MADQNTDAPEEWRPVPIPEYAELYEVSDLGRVRRVMTSHNNSWKAGRLVRPGVNPVYGHRHISLYRENKRICLGLHVLVALAFIGPRPSPRHEVAHDDGDPGNNRASNLKWATSSENKEDARRHGTMVIGERHCRAKLTEADVREMRALYGTGRYTQDHLAKQFGIHRTHVGDIVRGEKWRHVINP